MKGVIGGYISIGTYCIALYVYGGYATYYNSFVSECVRKENQNSKETKITQQIFLKQKKWSMLFGYFCTGFFNFMLKGKSLLDYTNVFSSNRYEMNN